MYVLLTHSDNDDDADHDNDEFSDNIMVLL